MNEVVVPVLIVGGGGCGLSCSIFLSSLGVEHLLVEAHESTSNLPKAHYLNQRTLEIFRQHGVADSIYAVGTPIESLSRVLWRTSFGGDGPLDGIVYHSMDTFGGGSLQELYDRDSPCRASNYPQMRLEPLLRRHAEERAPDAVRFGHTLVDWEQTDEGVTARVATAGGDELSVRARYVVVADGGRTVGPRLGVVWEGPTGLVEMVSTHFSADLSPWWDDKTWASLLLNPEGVDSWGIGALIQHGPTWGRHSEEWVMHFSFRPDDPVRFDEAATIERVRRVLKLPDIDLAIHKVSHWVVDRVIADRFRVGPFLIAGDAAHRQPPTSGLGLNSAIHDVHNLAWKLALVLSGAADDALLDSYEVERRPVDTANADWAFLMWKNHALLDAGLGLQRGVSVEENFAALEQLFSNTPLGETLRARARIVLDTQAAEFQDHDVELGFSYTGGAIVADGTEPPPRDPLGQVYVPTTRPGHRLPHTWLEGDDGRVSSHDLVPPGGFALLVGAEGGGWVEAAPRVAAKYRVTIDAHSIGDGYRDLTGRWRELSEIGDGGAVLVRADHHVGWRAAGAAPDADAALGAAVGAILRGDAGS